MRVEDAIRDFYGRIIGYVETDNQGNKTVRDFYGNILGYYKKALDATTDFQGRIVAKGDAAAALIMSNRMDKILNK